MNATCSPVGRMDNGSTLLNSPVDAHWLGPPGPKLLMELEPAHRVFFSNLFDVLLRRQVPYVDLVSKPADFWGDVFVPAGAPWWAFLESVLWHASAVLALLIISQGWGPRIHIDKTRTETSRIIYYRPMPTFPARESSPPRTPVRRENRVESQHAIQVPREMGTRPG